MSRILHLTFVMCLLSGCMTRKGVSTADSAFSEPPPAAPREANPAYPMPQPVSDSVRGQALAAYSKTYWFQIYPEMRTCTKVKGIAGYSATFGKSGQPLVRFPKADTKWDAINVEFDDAVRILKLYRVRYE